MTKPIRWNWVLFAGLFLLLAGILRHPLNHLIFSVRLASAMQSVASGATGEELEVMQLKIRRKTAMRDYEALAYCPNNSFPTRALVLGAGISEHGCYHPRLVAFSRLLADRGFLVITPDIRALREFRITAEPIEEMLFWHNQVSSLERGRRVEKKGLAGISFSGTLALMAAANPEVQGTVAFVAAIGPYYNLPRCTEEWFAAGSVTHNTDYYPTRFYGRWVAMLSALEMLPARNDRLLVATVLRNLLLQKKIPAATSELTSEGKRWYRLAAMLEGESDPILAQEIAEHLTQRLYQELDPEDALKDVRCPVFLIHGTFDDLIPPRESLELQRRLKHSYLLISPFLTHTHPSRRMLSWSQKTAAAWEMLVFFFQFSRVVS